MWVQRLQQWRTTDLVFLFSLLFCCFCSSFSLPLSLSLFTSVPFEGEEKHKHSVSFTPTNLQTESRSRITRSRHTCTSLCCCGFRATLTCAQKEMICPNVAADDSPSVSSSGCSVDHEAPSGGGRTKLALLRQEQRDRHYNQDVSEGPAFVGSFWNPSSLKKNNAVNKINLTI